MLFKRVLHDGLSTVIHRKGKATITFIRGEFETVDREQIDFLTGEGYASEGERPDFLVHEESAPDIEEPAPSTPPSQKHKKNKRQGR